MTGFEEMTEAELVERWFGAAAELERRGAKLWHIGDLTEIIVASALGLRRAKSNVQKGYDVTDADGRRIQVKALVNRPGNKRTSVGFFRPGTYDEVIIVRFAVGLASAEGWRFGPEVVDDFAAPLDSARGARRLTLTNKLTRDPRVTHVEIPLPISVAMASLDEPGDYATSAIFHAARPPNPSPRRSAFTADEITELKKLVREKQTAPADRQKQLRSSMRKMGFYISDYSNQPGFVESDLDALIQRGTIAIVDRD